MTTIYDIAKQCQVSAATVSRALKNDPTISEKTRVLVQKKAAELNYHKNALAMGLKFGKSDTIGVITNDLTTFAVPNIVNGIEEEANNCKYNVILCNTNQEKAKEKHYIRVLKEKQIDGLIFVGTWIELDRKCIFQNIGLPFVAINRHYESGDVCTVNHDDINVAYIATEYLIKKGHRNIALINGPMDLISPPGRQKGFVAAMDDYGLPISDQWMVSGSWHYDNGYKHTKAMIDSGYVPDAIVAGNDLIAVGVIRAAHDAGLTVPGDIAVIGCDDREIAHNYNPRLSTIKLPLVEMGREAVNSLFAKMGGESVASSVLKSSIVVRESA